MKCPMVLDNIKTEEHGKHLIGKPIRTEHNCVTGDCIKWAGYSKEFTVSKNGKKLYSGGCEL